MAAEDNEGEQITKKIMVSVTVPRPFHPHSCAHVAALEVSSDDTVASVKARLHDMVGIPPRLQRLVFPRSALPDEDGTTLADHGVADSSTIQLVETKMQVLVRCWHGLDGRTVILSGIESCDTVESFRLRLQQREDIRLRPAHQRLECGMKPMEDGHTLAEYGVRECTMITLHARPIHRRKREVELDIEVTDTVGKIKKRVEEVEGVPVAWRSVYYCTKELDDAQALSDEKWVNIVCQRHEKSEATKTGNKGHASMAVQTKAVKRRADTDVSGPGKKIKEKPLEEIPDVQRRRLSVNLIGPELAAICPSSCDTDPAI
ncbi:hypothetical protein ACQ4PT_056428 [Festuca glaucescens]